jgi:hypothetical protein
MNVNYYQLMNVEMQSKLYFNVRLWSMVGAKMKIIILVYNQSSLIFVKIILQIFVKTFWLKKKYAYQVI